jgi:hypothetical protein
VVFKPSIYIQVRPVEEPRELAGTQLTTKRIYCQHILLGSKNEIFDRPTYLLLVHSAVYLRNVEKNDRDPAGSKTEIDSETLGSDFKTSPQVQGQGGAGDSSTGI